MFKNISMLRVKMQIESLFRSVIVYNDEYGNDIYYYKDVFYYGIDGLFNALSYDIYDYIKCNKSDSDFIVDCIAKQKVLFKDKHLKSAQKVSYRNQHVKNNKKLQSIM